MQLAQAKENKMHIISANLLLFPFPVFAHVFYFILFIYFLFSQSRISMFTWPTTMRNYKHCFKFYSQKVKQVAVNCLPIGEAEL